MYVAEFQVLGEIMTKQRPRATMRGGFARVYTPKNTTNYENYIKTLFQDKYGNKNFGYKPLKITVICYFKANQQIEKEFAKNDNIENRKEEILQLPCKTNKDVDNVVKIVMDSLNGIAFYDDKQIVEICCKKFYTLEQERLEVKIESLEDDFDFVNLQHYKDILKMKELEAKVKPLEEKELNHIKLKKAEEEKLYKYNRQWLELNEKIKDKNSYLNDK